jgi:hypothetical protein
MRLGMSNLKVMLPKRRFWKGDVSVVKLNLPVVLKSVHVHVANKKLRNFAPTT